MLDQLIQSKKIKVGIIGQGYVGLPLALEFSGRGVSVTGFEVDSNKVKALLAGKSYILDIPSERIRAQVQAGRLKPTTDFKQLSKMDAIIICVPTPLRKSKEPDLSYIISAVEKIRPNLRKGQLIVLESTTYPGTTREVVQPMVEERGFKVGKDVLVAFSPERVDPGNKKFSIHNTPKIVGGISKDCQKAAYSLYSIVCEKVVQVSSPEAAEMVKLFENTFRAVNIGLVNELALICNQLKLDVWEVLDAAATKPFGYMPFYPGPGLGGHCIPLDPHYLSWKLKTMNFYARFIELAAELNANMPDYVVRRVIDILNQRKKSIKDAKVLVLGVAYKKDISDWRESPALEIIEKFHEKNAVVHYHDPYVPSIDLGGHRMKSIPLNDTALKGHDCAVIVTNHSAFNARAITDKSQLVFDTRNATKGISSPKIVKL